LDRRAASRPRSMGRRSRQSQPFPGRRCGSRQAKGLGSRPETRCASKSPEAGTRRGRRYRAALLRLKDDFPTDNREEHTRVFDFLRRNLEEVIREDNDVREFAGRERSLLRLLKGGICATERV